MWPIGSIVRHDAEVLDECVQGHDQRLEFRRDGDSNHAGNLGAWPEFKPVEAQMEGLNPDLPGARQQFGHLLLWKVTDECQRYVPAAAIQGLALNCSGDRINHVTQAVTLSIIRPKREKESFPGHLPKFAL
jgi:hypothetical protein